MISAFGVEHTISKGVVPSQRSIASSLKSGYILSRHGDKTGRLVPKPHMTKKRVGQVRPVGDDRVDMKTGVKAYSKHGGSGGRRKISNRIVFPKADNR